MGRRGILLLPATAALLVLLSCRETPVTLSKTPSLEKAAQLVVATRRGEVSFEVPIEKTVLPRLLVSTALIRVTCDVSVDWFVDFRKDAPRLRREGSNLVFEGGPLRAKEPVVHESRIRILESGLLVNEEKEARLVLEKLASRLREVEVGWRDAALSNAANASLCEFLTELSRGQGLAVETTLVRLDRPDPAFLSRRNP